MIIDDAIVEQALAKAVAQKLDNLDIEDLRLIDAKQGAKMFSTTPRVIRALAANTFDLGPCRTRWSIRELRQILEARKVKRA